MNIHMQPGVLIGKKQNVYCITSIVVGQYLSDVITDCQPVSVKVNAAYVDCVSK